MLRDHADDGPVLAAVIDFLQGRESDLIACASALDLSPESLVRAGKALSEGPS